MTTRPVYATRGMVIHALDTTPTPRLAAAIDRALAAASTIVDDAAKSFFYPLYATRTRDWPDAEIYTSRSLYLWTEPLTQATQITVAGAVLAAGSYHLRPVDGPPYTEILLDRDVDPGYWSTDPTTGIENAISIQGLWGNGADKTTPAGDITASAGITDTATTLVLGSVSQPLRADVGGILAIESEIVLVTGASWVDTTIDVGLAGITASTASTVLPVTATTGLAPGQWIIVGSEKLLILDILSSTSVLVDRAQHGTVLAAHSSGDAVFAPWSLTVERGALGTTAAAHAASTPVSAHTPPGLVEQATVASAIAQVLDQTAGYASPAGPSGGAVKQGVTGAGAGYLLDRVAAEYALSTRTGAI